MAVELARGAYVRLLAAVYASMFLIRVAFGISVVTFADYLEADDFVYSLVVTASPVLELITVVFAGVLIDRYGRKGILLTGLALGSISLYGLALTKNPFILAAVNAIHGVAAALILVTTLAVIATFAPPERRGREMGTFNVANLFGWLAGFVIGFLMLDIFHNVAYTFIIAGTLAALGLIPVNQWVTLRNEASMVDPHARPSLRDLAAAVTNPQIALLTLPWFIVFMLVGAFITFLPRVAGEALQLSGGSTALGLVVFAALLVGSQLIWGRLADRHGRETIMLVGAIGFALFMGLIAYSYFETGPTTTTQALASFTVDTPAAAQFGIMAVAGPSGPTYSAPIVEAVEPQSGPPGTIVTIRGLGLDQVNGVVFAGARATFEVVDSTLLTATVPAGASSGPLELKSPTSPQLIFRNVMSHWFLLIVFLFTALAFAPAGLAAIADEAKEGAKGTTMSFYSLTLSMGFIFGPPIVGAISEAVGGTGMVVYFAVLAFILVALVVTRILHLRVLRRRGVLEGA